MVYWVIGMLGQHRTVNMALLIFLMAAPIALLPGRAIRWSTLWCALFMGSVLRGAFVFWC